MSEGPIIKEIYGNPNASRTVKVGNGGAGPTGVIRALAEAFLKENNLEDVNIGWIQTISFDSLQNIKNKKANISLTYEPHMELEAINEGYAQNYEYVFKDHFWLVGPKNGISVDSTIKPIEGIASTDDIIHMFLRISQAGQNSTKPIFITRDDLSGTVITELSVWRKAGVELPTAVASTDTWYYRMPSSAPRFPADCLKLAREWGCLTFVDRGTFLTDVNAQTELKVYLEGSDSDTDLILNPCHALVSKGDDEELTEISKKFVNFMASVKGQTIVKSYGKDHPKNISNIPLYTPSHPELLKDA